MKPTVFSMWQEKRKMTLEDGTVKWVSKSSKIRDKKYREKFAEVHGAEANPETAPLDTEVVMLAGQGKKKCRFWIAESIVPPSSIPTMRQIRRGRTSGMPRVETRPTPSPVAQQEWRVCSSSLVIQTSLHDFHCNIHDLLMTKRRLKWPPRGHGGRSPRRLRGRRPGDLGALRSRWSRQRRR